MEIKPVGFDVYARETAFRSNIAADFGSGTIIAGNLVQPSRQYMMVSGTSFPTSVQMQALQVSIFPHQGRGEVTGRPPFINEVFTTQATLPSDMSPYANMNVVEIHGATSVLVSNGSPNFAWIHLREEGYLLSNVLFTSDLNGTFTCDAAKLKVNDLVTLSGKTISSNSRITSSPAYASIDTVFKVIAILEGVEGVSVTKFKLGREGSGNLTTTFATSGSTPGLTFKVVGDLVGRIKVPAQQTFKIEKNASQTLQSSVNFASTGDNTNFVRFTPLAITD